MFSNCPSSSVTFGNDDVPGLPTIWSQKNSIHTVILILQREYSGFACKKKTVYNPLHLIWMLASFFSVFSDYHFHFFPSVLPSCTLSNLWWRSLSSPDLSNSPSSEVLFCSFTLVPISPRELSSLITERVHMHSSIPVIIGFLELSHYSSVHVNSGIWYPKSRKGHFADYEKSDKHS